MKAFLLLFRLFVCGSVAYSMLGCELKMSEKSRVISGVISGLPDGVMYLKDISLSKIDSCPTSAGRFEFRIASEKFPEPIYAEMVHVASADSTFRTFIFPTKHKINGKPINQALLMLDLEGITMNGTIHDSFFAKKSSSSSIEGAVKFGKQTNMFLADTFNFNGRVKLKDLKKMILANPFSYHLLYSVKNIRHSLSDRQILSLLECFDDDVKASNTASEMKSYIASRGKIKLNNTTLTDSAGRQHLILDQKAKLNMVILWASWCGPCRAEIPQLKKVYKKFMSNKNFKMVSVSVDSENLKWKKALKEEKMPWKQLLTEREKADYYKELFDVNNSIPTTLFYDSNGKLIKKYIGYDAANEVEVMDLIIANLK